MKSKRRKRVIASVLCMVLMLSTGISTLAEADAGAVPAVEETTAAQTTTQETESTSTETKTVETEAQAQAETETQTETKQTEEAVQTQPEETTAAQPTEEASGGETTQTETDQTAQNTQDQTTSAETSGTETQNETVETQPEETETTMQTEVTQETKEEASVSPAFNETYENSEVTVKVTADEGIVPEGAELSVTPIVKKEITDQMSEEEKAEAKKINDQYDLTEKKLSEDSDKNKEIMEGFLAYDISFLVDGKEVEPSGDVDVTMEFRKATAPEGASEDAAVTVKHLKEDQTAEDGIVVENMDETASVEMTEKAEVEKVRLISDQFSTYVIHWGSYSGTLNVMVVDENGNEIGENGEVYLDNGNATNASSIAAKINVPVQYAFQEARVGSSFQSAQKAEAFQRSKKNQWHRNSQDSWHDVGNSTVWFVFHELTPIPTEDTRDLIQISLFDYQLNNNMNGLLFNGAGDHRNNRYNDWIGNWETGSYSNPTKLYAKDDCRAVQGIVSKQLVTADGQNITGGNVFSTTGFPVTTVGSGNNTSSELFNSNKRKGTGLNHLFQKDQDGYYFYNSDDNYAYYDGNSRDFTVYNESVSKGSDDLGDFMPLTKPAAESSWYYGMTVSFNFIQPEGGEINGNDMVFEFSGDDDVWVFVDGKLVLDIGGIHGATGGTINFATGEVVVDNVVDGSLSGTSGPKYGLNTTLQDIFGEDVFEDFSEHRLDFYYLERGAGDSNCNLKFNIQPIPDKTITVGKNITDSNASVYSDVEFTFQVETQDSSENWQPVKKIVKTGDDGKETLTNELEVYDESNNYLRTIEIDVDGKFKLRDGERVYLTGFPIDTVYRVTELDVSSNEYDNVTIAGVQVELIGNDGSSETQKGHRTEEINLNERGTVIFNNKIAAQNQKELQITKELNGSDGGKQYHVKVYLGEEAGKENGTPYNGKYYIDGVEHEAENGIITLQRNETAAITDIPSGTSFKVVEVDLDSDVYEEPSYQVQNAEDPGTDGAATGVLILDENTQVTVTNYLKSEQDIPYIKVQKTFDGMSDPKTEAQDFKIEIAKAEDTGFSNPVATLTLKGSPFPEVGSDGKTYTWKLENLPAGEYLVRESGANIPGYILDSITVNGDKLEEEQVLTFTSTGLSIKTQEASYKFDEGKRILECNDPKIILDFRPNLIVGTFTSQAGYFVWTEDTLSSGEREAVVSQIASTAKGTFNSITVAQTAFFSTEERIEDGINYRGTVSIKEEGDQTKLIFSGSSQWSQVYYAHYTKDPTVNAELEITNSYQPDKVLIDLQKFGSNYMKPYDGATFALYEGTKDGTDPISWEQNPMEEYDSIQVTENNLKELELPEGYYKLTETAAPDGFSLLEEDILFQVQHSQDGMQIFLIDQDGNPINDTDPDRMWQIVDVQNAGEDQAKRAIQIKNKAIYELPEAGGSGTFGYTIGGVLLLMAGTLILYKLKDREVLKK